MTNRKVSKAVVAYAVFAFLILVTELVGVLFLLLYVLSLKLWLVAIAVSLLLAVVTAVVLVLSPSLLRLVVDEFNDPSGKEIK